MVRSNQAISGLEFVAITISVLLKSRAKIVNKQINANSTQRLKIPEIHMFVFMWQRLKSLFVYVAFEMIMKSFEYESRRLSPQNSERFDGFQCQMMTVCTNDYQKSSE